jgi:hypothetical protein
VDILDFVTGDLMAKWLEPTPLGYDPKLRELHLLFFDIGDPQGGRFNKLDAMHPVIVDTGNAVRWNK